MSAGRHLDEALAAESEAYSALLAGEPAQEQLLRARDAYLAWHEESSATSWGRLIGALKMAILADDGVERIAGQAIAETDETEPSPASAYARSLAQLALGERPQVEPMLDTGDAFERTGRAMAALAAGDREQYNRALAEIMSRLRRPRRAPLRRGGGRHGHGARAAGRPAGPLGRSGQPAPAAGLLTIICALPGDEPRESVALAARRSPVRARLAPLLLCRPDHGGDWAV